VADYTQSSARTSYLATDLLGSVRLATDPSGAVIGAGGYDAWGNAMPYTGSSGPTQLAGLQASSPFGFAGQRYDAGPGTYAMRARTYSPSQGRFQSIDPLLNQTGQTYAYANDNPVSQTDPSGQDPNPGASGFSQAAVLLDSPAGIKDWARQRVQDMFVATDRERLTYANVNLVSPNLIPYINDPTHADLISFSSLTDRGGYPFAEIYDLVPDPYVNFGGTDPMYGFDNFARDRANLASFQQKGASQALFANGVMMPGSFGKLPAISGSACRAGQRHIYLGTNFPIQLSVLTRVLETGPGVRAGSTTPAGQVIEAGLPAGAVYKTGGEGRVPYIEAAFNGSTYHIFARLLAPGIVGYSACVKGQNWLDEHGMGAPGCHDPGWSLPTNDGGILGSLVSCFGDPNQFAACASTVATTADLITMIAVWVPGGQSVASVTGSVGFLAGAAAAGTHVAEWAMYPSYRKDTTNRVGLLLDLGALAIGGGSFAYTRIAEHTARVAMDTAKSSNMLKSAIQQLEQNQKDVEALNHDVDRVASGPVVVLDVINKAQEKLFGPQEPGGTGSGGGSVTKNGHLLLALARADGH
jgi:RHS repeat-associated protein